MRWSQRLACSGLRSTLRLQRSNIYGDREKKMMQSKTKPKQFGIYDTRAATILARINKNDGFMAWKVPQYTSVALLIAFGLGMLCGVGFAFF
tara:strand:+ start:129 stop:404 length:276 start_codon:yes stop_codon:yes gene_type:complete